MPKPKKEMVAAFRSRRADDGFTRSEFWLKKGERKKVERLLAILRKKQDRAVCISSPMHVYKFGIHGGTK